MACILEVTARKPGNVHRYADFADATLVDFLLSATAIAGPLDRAAGIGVGGAILEAVEATRAVVATNTNLGMILLLAPLAAAGDDPATVARVVERTTVDDARLVYRAIRLARPGGLGSAGSQDVGGEPTVTLLEAMRLAADRDAIARQYAHGYADVFAALAGFRDELAAGLPLEPAIVRTHLRLMAGHPDTLIARKRGRPIAAEAAERAARALEGAEIDLHALDAWLRGDGHARNPGATADLVAAVLFLALRDGTISLPRPAGPAGWSGSH